MAVPCPEKSPNNGRRGYRRVGNPRQLSVPSVCPSDRYRYERPHTKELSDTIFQPCLHVIIPLISAHDVTVNHGDSQGQLQMLYMQHAGTQGNSPSVHTLP